MEERKTAEAHAHNHKELGEHGEFIWQLASAGKTQQEIAEILGWSRDLVARYHALNRLSDDTWQVVVVTIKQELVTNHTEDTVTNHVTPVTKSPFTEGLLRHIVNLTARIAPTSWSA